MSLKTNIYNQKGEVIEKIPLNEEVFQEEFNPDFLHQVYKIYLSNRYPRIAFSKDRSEVAGGGKKPWKQKGTGRARHGSIRSPLWRGGGATFGPRRKEESLKKKINQKTKQKALRMILAKKIEDQEIKIIDSFNGLDIKTKVMDQLLKNIIPSLKKKTSSTLVILKPETEKAMKRGLRNLPYLDLITTENLDFLQLLNNKYLLLSKDSFLTIQEKLKKTSK